MKDNKKQIALLSVFALILGVFAGCSSGQGGTGTTSGTVTSAASTQSTTYVEDETGGAVDEETIQNDMIGEVYYISTDLISLDLYEADEEVTDYLALDLSALAYAGTYDTIVPDEETVYYKASVDGLLESSLDEIEQGDLIAVTYDNDGAMTIILLKKASSGESVVAKVMEIADENMTVTLYENTSSDASITDYAKVDLTLYTETADTDVYIFDGAECIYLVSDGELADAGIDDIAVGDMLVFFTDAYGAHSIAIYPAEEA